MSTSYHKAPPGLGPLGGTLPRGWARRVERPVVPAAPTCHQAPCWLFPLGSRKPPPRWGTSRSVLFCSCSFPRCCTRGPRHSTRVERSLLCPPRSAAAMPSVPLASLLGSLRRGTSVLPPPGAARGHAGEGTKARLAPGAGGAGLGAGPSARPASTRPGGGLPPALPCLLVAEAPREKYGRKSRDILVGPPCHCVTQTHTTPRLPG